jgi:phosphatidylglycerophosphate synthase
MYGSGLQNCSSAFGAFLDPVADKLMVAAVLVLLSTQPIAAGPLAGNAWLLPVLTLGKHAMNPRMCLQQ